MLDTARTHSVLRAAPVPYTTLFRSSVTVNALPTVVINADGPTAICPGSSVILTASGAASYVWSPGGQTTAAITVTGAGAHTVEVQDDSECVSSVRLVKTNNALTRVV